jgi:microcystin-dependent protein
MQYISELRIFSFGFAPKGWALCNGQLLSIPQNTALFTLLGTAYGGDGIRTFGLPNLMGRVPMHVGPGIKLAQAGGEEAHQLLVSEMPNHTHNVTASGKPPDVNRPDNANWASSTGFTPYGAPGTQLMAPGAMMSSGGNLPHQNMSPYSVVSICIALTGQYPTHG